MKSGVLIALLLGLAAAAAPAQELPGRLHTVPSTEDRPGLIIRPLSAPPLVAVRLSIRVAEAAEPVGAAGILQELARESFAERVARFGGRTVTGLTATHAIYEVAGPVEAFEEMLAALRSAVGPPSAETRQIAAAWSRYRGRALAELETPEPLLRRQLRERLFPVFAASAAFDARGAPSRDALSAFWSAVYRPERTSVVVVGAVEPDRVRRAFEDWHGPAPATGDETVTPADVGWEAPEPPEPQVLFTWAGLGFEADAEDPAVLAVAARLVEERLHRAGIGSPRAELWWSDGERALVVLGSTRGWGEGSDGDVDGLRTRLRRAISETAALAEAEEVAAARSALRQELLLAARTPQGLGSVIGSFHDRTGDAEAAGRFWSGLDQVDAIDVRSALLMTLARTPVTAEVRP